MMRLIAKVAIFILAICFVYGPAFADEQQLTLDKVVIDAGHGGKDPGAVSKDKQTFEKDLVLKISKVLGDKMKERYLDSLTVYYTRTTDVFVPLQDRADFANKKHADLFISVHINAAYNPAISGHSVHILGASSNPDRDLKAGNLDVCKRENSVIMLEDDYTTTYQGFDPSDEASYIFMTLMQDAYYEQCIYFASLTEQSLVSSPLKVSRGVEQNPFYVLWKTSMPSVLLELGFISNDADLAVLKTQEGIDSIADCILKAFCQYKQSYDESMKLH